MALRYKDIMQKNTMKKMTSINPTFENLVDTKTLAPMSTLDDRTVNMLEGISSDLGSGVENGMSSMGGFTAGDWVGMAGTLAGGISQMMNTISAAKSTKPVVNRYLGFNEKALAANAETENQIEMNEDTSKRATKRALKLKSNTAKERTRNSSTGLSQLRSLDLATDYSTNESEIAALNQLESIFGQQRVETKSRKEGLLTQQDQMEMSAAERNDEKIQQNIDNRYSNMAINLAGITESMQKIGQDLNSNQYKKDFLDVLPYTNPYNIGFAYQNGNWIMDTQDDYEVTNPVVKRKSIATSTNG